MFVTLEEAKGYLLSLIHILVETPEETGLGRCECRISRIGRKEGFEDAGHAMAWALTNVK